jgi:predicted MFS family arabinose efflux permease
MAISLAFGLTALKYPIGDFARAGPGLFPAMVSTMLFMIGVATVVRSRYVDKVRLDMNMRNIGIILGSLCAFAVVTLFVNMTLGIIAMVFISTIAGKTYSWKRNVKICIGLLLMALMFAKLLGMNLPLY